MKKAKLNHFKSKLFIKLFLSYLIIITLFLVAFSGLIIYDAISMYHSKKNQEYHLKIEALANSMDLQILSAKNIIASVNSSETIRQMYTSVVVEKKSLDPYLFYQGLGEISNMKKLSNNLDIFNIIVLFNGYNRAYTGSSVILLKEEFHDVLKQVPYYGINTASHVLEMKDMNEIIFSKESIVYGDNYRYSLNGAVNGTILVMYNKKSLENKIKNIVGSCNGLSIRYDNEEVIRYGQPKGNVFVGYSDVDNKL